MCLATVTPAGSTGLHSSLQGLSKNVGPILSSPPNLPYFQPDSPYTCVFLKCVTPRAGEAEAQEGKQG